MKLFVLGNSHTRSFANNDYIIPVFFGPASKYSLRKGFFDKTKNKIISFLESEHYNKNDIILLNMGEGLIRYEFKKTLYPHTILPSKWDDVYKEEKKLNSTEETDKGIDKYINLYYELKHKYKNIKILSIIGSFTPIINRIKYSNQRISEILKEDFINLDRFLYDDNNNVINEFIDYNFPLNTPHRIYKNFQFDPIHLNNKVGSVLVNILKPDRIDHTQIKLKKNPRFNSYLF